MGFFGKSGLESAFNVASLLLQDIVARSITLTQTAGNFAVNLTGGAYLSFNSPTNTVYLRALSGVLKSVAFHPDADNTYDLGNLTNQWRFLYLSAGLQMASTDSSGAPGNAVINQPNGRSAIALGASTVTITNSLVTAASHVFISPRTRDATGLLPLVTTIAAGSFAVTTTANTTAALTFDWLVTT